MHADSERCNRRAGHLSLACLGIFGSGVVALASLESRLILTLPTPYANVQGLLFALLFLVSILVVTMNKRLADSLAVKNPTRLLRWFVMKPAVAAVMAGSVLATPPGWIAFGTWAWGTATQVPGGVVEVGRFYRSKGCDQKAKLAVQGFEKTVCLVDHYRGVALVPGQQLDVQLRSTSLGIIIGDIAPQ